MNSKGQTIMMAVLFAVFLFMFGMLFLNFIHPVAMQAQSDLDCSNVGAISDGTKLACLLTDGIVPYFIILIVSTAGGIIMARIAL